MRMSKSVKFTVAYGVGFTSLRMLIGAFSVVYMLNRGVDIKDVGLLKSYQFTLVLLLDFPLSYIADKYSRKFSIIMAGLLGGAYLVVMGLGNGLGMFFVAETLNALSLLFFGGAYVSYLIDLSSTSAKEILGLESKYSYLFAAFAGVVGAIFVNVDSNFIWFLSGAVLLSWASIFAFVLPNDSKIHDSPQKISLKESFLEFRTDMHVIFTHIRSELLKIFIALLSISVIMQIIIQLWQTFVSDATDKRDGYIYAVAIGLIFLAQSFSGQVAHMAGKTNMVSSPLEPRKISSKNF